MHDAAYQERPEHHHAHERDQRGGGHDDRPHLVRPHRSGQPHHGGRCQEGQQAKDDTDTTGALLQPGGDGAGTQRRQRSHPGGAQSGHECGQHGHHGADDESGHDRGRGHDHGDGRVTAHEGATEAGPEHPDPHTREHTKSGGDQTDHQRLGQDRAEHLGAFGAHAPQQSHFTLALGDEDGKGVVDDDPGDEHRDEGEQQQSDPHHLGVGTCVLGHGQAEILPRSHIGPGTKNRRHGLGHLLVGVTLGGDHIDLVVVGDPGHRLGGGLVEHQGTARAEACVHPEVDQADDGEFPLFLFEVEDGHRVTDPEVGLLCGGGGQGDLVPGGG